MNTHFDYSFSRHFYEGRKFATADEATEAARVAANNAYPPNTLVEVFVAEISSDEIALVRSGKHSTPSADPIGKEAEHTSGPWYHMGAGNIMDSPTEGGNLLATVKGKAHSDEWLQNVRLVVAAPEMLKALRVVCEHPYPWALVEAQKAIDRAVKGV